MTANVFKDCTHKKPVENLIEGYVGYVVIKYADQKLQYSAEYGVWHLPGIDLERHKNLLRAPRPELQATL